MKDNKGKIIKSHDQHDNNHCIAEDKKEGGDNMLSRLVWGHDKSGPLNGIADALSPYSSMEIRVAELSSEGKSDEEIAQMLRIEPQHVGELKREILAKARACMRGC